MIRSLSIALLVCLGLDCQASVYYSVNFDRKTEAAMASTYALEVAAEAMNNESVQKILDHYTSAEVATAGIFASKWFDRKALTNVGPFGTAEENYYYARIRRLVVDCIRPKLWSVGSLMIRHPDKALYWGPYLYKTCNEVVQLCMQFETIVTNGRLTFQDIAAQGAFLVIGDDLKAIFDLARLGEVDWSAVWDHLVDFGNGLTKEDLKDDLDNLLSAGTAIAGAGAAVLDSTWTQASKIGTAFKQKPREIIQLYYEFRDLYDTFSDPDAVKDLVMARLLSTDSTGVARLFTADGYHVTSYVSDYIKEMQGQYYTQRWYIYWRDSGSELLCDYAPPTDDNSVLNGPEWYRVSTSDENYVATAADREAALSNSESYAGWSRARCEQLHQADPKYYYNFYPSMWSSRIYKQKSGRTTAFAYAYSIKVYKEWNSYEEVYEEVFDSQTMDLNAFRKMMEAKLLEYNSREEDNAVPKTYYIGMDTKRYYQAADEKKLNGCVSVSFTLNCHDGAKLGEGSFQWKENGDQYHCLNEDSKRFAMESTLSGGPDTGGIDAEISTWAAKVNDLQNQINALEARNRELLAQISKVSVEEAAPLREQYNANMSQINSLRSQLTIALAELNRLQQGKSDMLADYYDEEDGAYRIPALMHDLEGAYGIEWSDGGSWSGYTFTRKGYVRGMNGSVTLTCDLKKVRGESWLINFWGIRILRIHRAILGVEWKLTAEYSSSDVVDIMELDPGLSDREKTDAVNRRMQEILAEYPSCSVDVDYAYSAPPGADDDQDSYHLLWVSDRLRIARQVDYRLSRIYAELLLLEKFMYSRQSLLDYLKAQVFSGLGDGVRNKVYRKSFRRWRNNSRRAWSGDEASLEDDDDDNS
ncbi:MAG: hypothetical protein J6Z14_05610 [Prevotella sp.]|nr:hypothetical protein [Prevotella sp.]